MLNNIVIIGPRKYVNIDISSFVPAILVHDRKNNSLITI